MLSLHIYRMKNKDSISSEDIRKVMSALGKISAKKRKKKGHNSEYYRQLVNKRWCKKKNVNA